MTYRELEAEKAVAMQLRKWSREDFEEITLSKVDALLEWESLDADEREPWYVRARALIAEAREEGKPPWDRICPVCGHGFAIDPDAPPGERGNPPSSAGTEGPGLAILQGVGHLEGYVECPSCKACWRTGEREVHWWDCKKVASRAARVEGEKHE
jgi:hypothetical protein